MALNYKLIGERLKDARLKKEYTQEQLAELMKLSVAYISRVESGKTRVNLKRLNEMCSLLDTTAGFILDGTSQDAPHYLEKELGSMLKDITAEEKELVYHMTEIIQKSSKKNK